MEKRFDYFICGDYEVCGNVRSCLICLGSRNDEAQANKKLQEVLANPPQDCLGNIHIEKEESNNCWWNQGNLD